MPRYPAISSASDGLSAGVYQGLAALAREHAPEVFALNVGDTYRPPPACARVRSDEGHGYAAVQGDPALLDAIVSRMQARGTPVKREQLQVVAGATLGLGLVCEALLSPGEGLLLPSPFWPLISGIAKLSGALTQQLPFYTQVGHANFDVAAALDAQITAQTAAIYVNSPNNPTGAVLAAHHLDAIAQVAEAHDLWVICDQAYDELVYSAGEPTPMWMHPGLRERAVVAHTLSKAYGLAGARIGFVHGPPAAMRAVADLQAYRMYCAAKPMQLAAARALQDPEGATWQADARAAYAVAGQQAAAVLGVEPPASGTFLFFDTKPLRRVAEDRSAFLQRCARAGVVMAEGPACGEHFEDWARLCFTAVDPRRLERALDALRTTLDDRG